MVAFSKIKVGDVLYDCHKYTAGNTNIRKMGTWPVKVIEVYPPGALNIGASAMVSWNGNKPRIYTESKLKRLRRSRPKD
jgi:hypothetical protein